MDGSIDQAICRTGRQLGADKLSSDSCRVLNIGEPGLFGKDAGRQPLEQRSARLAHASGLRKVKMRVDITGGQHAQTSKVVNRIIGLTRPRKDSEHASGRVDFDTCVVDVLDLACVQRAKYTGAEAQ